MRSRLLPAVFLPLLLAALPPAAAGEGEGGDAPSTLSEVRARLSADHDATVAWGAYLAGRDGHRDAVPALLEQLEPGRERGEGRWDLVKRAVVDALIRLDAHVPDAVVDGFDHRLAIHALMLCARAPEAHGPTLRKRFQRTKGAREIGLYDVALGNLLLRARTPGFARILVEDLPLDLKVRVHSPGDTGGTSGVSVSGGFGDAVARVPEGFPPYAWYTIQADDARGARLLAPGPRPVYWRRVERASSGLIGGGKIHRFRAHEVRAEWLAPLLDRDAADIEVPTKDSIRVAWTTPEAYVERVVRSRAALTAPYWALLRELHEARLVTKEEAFVLGPRVKVEIEDVRKDKSVGLPGIPPLERPADLREAKR